MPTSSKVPREASQMTDSIKERIYERIIERIIERTKDPSDRLSNGFSH